MNQVITTNLRINKNDLIQIKILAAEAGLSFNEYINRLIREQTLKNSFPVSDKYHSKRSGKKYSIWRPWKISEDIKTKPMDISEEDKIIYDLKD